MSDQIFIIISLFGSITGGALGAYFSRAPLWKGALPATLATIIQYAVATVADIEQPVVSSLIFLVAAGIIGGRWGLRLSGRQLSIIVIGSFLLSVVAAAVYVYFVMPAA